MTRAVCLVLAVAAGLCAAILLASGPTVHVNGKAAACPGIIATTEGGNVVDSHAGHGYLRACGDEQREWSVLAGLAAVVSLGAGSVAQFSRRDREAPTLPPSPRHDAAQA